MTLKTYELPYGDTVKTVALPEDEVIAEVRTKSFTPIPKEAVKSKILEAIRNPIGIGPLDERVKPGDTVCFICNDLTRVANSFDFMPVFLDELNRLGVPDDHMKIVFSLGAHRKMTRDEMAEAVGEEVAARVPLRDYRKRLRLRDRDKADREVQRARDTAPHPCLHGNDHPGHRWPREGTQSP